MLKSNKNKIEHTPQVYKNEIKKEKSIKIYFGNYKMKLFSSQLLLVLVLIPQINLPHVSFCIGFMFEFNFPPTKEFTKNIN